METDIASGSPVVLGMRIPGSVSWPENLARAVMQLVRTEGLLMHGRIT